MKSRKEPNLIRPPVPVSAAAGYGSPDAESIGTRQSDEFYADLDARLTSLLPRLQQAISLDDCHWVEEYIRAGEYGLAVEEAAQGLALLDDVPVPLAEEVLSAATKMELRTEPIVRLQAKVS